jgi:hypothetical protein
VLVTLLEHRTKAHNAVKYLIKQPIDIVFGLLEAIANGCLLPASDGVIAGGNNG